MTALDVLERCRSGSREIREMEESIALKRMALEGGSRQLDGMPRGSGPRDMLSSMACDIADLSRKLDARKQAYSAELCAGAWIVDRLPSAEKRVLGGWFLECKPLKVIAADCSYSISSVRRIRAAGIEACRAIDMRDLTGFLPEWYERAQI